MLLTQRIYLTLPNIITDGESRASILSKGYYLASSPRQRESDTGARMLSILFITISDETSRLSFLNTLLDSLEERVELMRCGLGIDDSEQVGGVISSSAFLSSNTKINGTRGHERAADVSSLPLAHGLICALGLIVNESKSSSFSLLEYGIKTQQTTLLHE